MSQTKTVDSKLLILPAEFIADPTRLQQMMESIKSEGLLHPPLVKEDYHVFAGKLRVLACQRLQLQSLECRFYPSDLPSEEYKRLSLHENLKRYNLPWYDQVTLEKELHELRQSQEGKAKQGKKVGWSLRDTATELNMAFGVLSEDIHLAEAVAADPTLRRIEDKATAKKIIYERLKRSNQEASAQVRPEIKVDICLQGGSEVLLQSFPNDTFDACITDPPWLEFRDASLTRDQFTLPVFKEVFRVLKSNSFLYAFVSTQDWNFYYEKLQAIGFSVQKFPLIWLKEGVLTYGTRTWEYQRDYEPIILAVKGSPALTGSMKSSVMSCKVVPSALLRHPNEKPGDIIKKLLYHSTYDSSLVLDPFAGSFIVPLCCKQTGRRYVAIEKEMKYYAAGLERLKDKDNKK